MGGPFLVVPLGRGWVGLTGGGGGLVGVGEGLSEFI